MKKILIMITIAAGLAACGNNAKLENGLVLSSRDSLKMIKDSLRLDSFERAELAKKEEAEKAAQQAVAARANSTRRSAPVQYYSPASSNGSTATTQKKGWSSAAKGAAIGAGAG